MFCDSKEEELESKNERKVEKKNLRKAVVLPNEAMPELTRVHLERQVYCSGVVNPRWQCAVIGRIKESLRETTNNGVVYVGRNQRGCVGH